MLRRFTTVAARSVDRGASCLAGARGFASSGASSGWFGGGKGAGVSGDARAGSGTVADLGDSASAALDRVAAASDAARAPPRSRTARVRSRRRGRRALESAHVFSGLPWWATIACGAVGVRLALFPFTLQQAKAGALLNTAIARARTDGKPPRSLGEILAAAVELRRRTGGVHPAWLVGSPSSSSPTSSPPSSPFDASPRDRTSVSRLAVRCGSKTSPRWLSTSTPSRRPWGFTARSSPRHRRRSSPTSTTRGEKSRDESPRRVAQTRHGVAHRPHAHDRSANPQAVHCYWLPSSLSALAQGAAMRDGFREKSARRRSEGRRRRRDRGTRRRRRDRGTCSVPSPSPSPSPSPGTVRFSRPLDEDESRLIREAAEARDGETRARTRRTSSSARRTWTTHIPPCYSPSAKPARV